MNKNIFVAFLKKTFLIGKTFRVAILTCYQGFSLSGSVLSSPFSVSRSPAEPALLSACLAPTAVSAWPYLSRLVGTR